MSETAELETGASQPQDEANPEVRRPRRERAFSHEMTGLKVRVAHMDLKAAEKAEKLARQADEKRQADLRRKEKTAARRAEAKRVMEEARERRLQRQREKMAAWRLMSMRQNSMAPGQVDDIRRQVRDKVALLTSTKHWTTRNVRMTINGSEGGTHEAIVSSHILLDAVDTLPDMFAGEVINVYTDGSYAWEEISECGEKTGGFSFLLNDAQGRPVVWGGGVTPAAMNSSHDYEYAAVQAALNTLPQGCRVRLHTDLMDIVMEMKGTRDPSGSLYEAVGRHQEVRFHKVRAHAGFMENNVVDELARRFRYAHDDMRCVMQSRLDEFQNAAESPKP